MSITKTKSYNNKNFIKKPVYTPPSQIRQGLYTEGKEWMYADSFEEYIGLYHKYPNDATYSEAQYYPEQSKPLIPYVAQSSIIEVLDDQGNQIGKQSANNSVYFRLTEKRFDQHYQPPFYYPDPSNEEYDVGFMTRFFAQRKNKSDDITEVTADEFDRKNSNNKPGIDEGLYRFLQLKWTIDGPLDEVRKANARVIKNAEIEERFFGLSFYLSDLDEFHKNRHKLTPKEIMNLNVETNLYTHGGQYELPNGDEYIGYYHLHPEKGAMVGAYHEEAKHDYLNPISEDSNTKSY